MTYEPPFQLTHTMTKRVAEISELIGAWKAVNHGDLVPELRRGNRIRTIQASLAVEQNTLSLEQVTAVLEGKTVLGLPREIQEVRNAFAAYENLEQWQPQQVGEAITQQHTAQTLKTRVKTPVKTRVKTADQILALLSTHAELSLADVAATIGRSISAVERAVAKLKTQNRLTYEGPKKGGKWKVIRQD